MNHNIRELNQILAQHQPDGNKCSGCDWEAGKLSFPEHQSEVVKVILAQVWAEAYSDGQGDESYSWVSSGASNDSYRYSIPRTNPYK